MAGEIDEARHVGRDVLEGLVGHRVHGLDLQGFHETLRLGVVVEIATRGALQTLGYFLPSGASFPSRWSESRMRSIVVTGASRT